MATPDPRDILALQSAVNDASSRTTALWVSFMTFAAYLIVAAGSVNHLALLQETPIKLPVLAAELPLVSYFAIAPFFLLLFHFYLFLNLVTLSRRIATYNRVLAASVAAEDDRNLLRSRLDTFLVVQMLSLPPRARDGLNAWLLNIVVWITLVGVPILLLLQFQLTFLPYHDSSVTWIHRILMVADLTMIWFFWFAIYKRGELHLPKPRRHLVALAGSAAVIFVSLIVVSYPGEWLGKIVNVKLPMVCPDKRVPISDCFLYGAVNMVTGRPRRYFVNVLVLPYRNLAQSNKVAPGMETKIMRGRDLTGAILIGSIMPSMDFTGANLDGARLDWAIAPDAIFACDRTGAQSRPPPKDPGWPDNGCASLRGASLYHAHLSGASFRDIHMEGAVLIEANLSGARFRNVHLEATVLTNANLTAANLGSTKLQYAYLFATNLSGATLEDSQLDGALLEKSQFQFASLGRFRKISVGNTVGQPTAAFAAFDLDGSTVPPPTNISQFKDMRNHMLQVLREEELRRNPWFATTLFPILTPAFYESYYEKAVGTNWGQLKVEVDDLWSSVKGQITLDTAKDEDLGRIKQRFLAERLIELACDSENAPFVARGLIQNDIMLRVGASAGIFLTKVLDIPNCRGAAEIKPEEYGAIRALSGVEIPDKTEIRPSVK